MFERGLAVFLSLSGALGCAGAARPENVAELPDEREGELSATPSTLDFGRVHVGNVVNEVMRLRNDGAHPIAIERVVVSPAVPVRTWLSSATVDPGMGTVLDVSFTPAGAAAHRAEVVITYRSSGAPEEQVLRIPITGQGG